MRFADISRQNQTWAISSQIAKGKRSRVLPLSDSALSIIDELSEGNSSEWVFRNSRNGDRLKSLDKCFQRVRRSAGLDGSGIVIHTLRHQAASMMLAAGTDLETLRNIMGHTDLSTTQIYLHASGQSLREGADSIEDYLANARAKETS
jgi:site-specific recombinase XerD